MIVLYCLWIKIIFYKKNLVELIFLMSDLFVLDVLNVFDMKMFGNNMLWGEKIK